MRRLLLVLALALAGCASAPRPDLTPLWDEARYAAIPEPSPEALFALTPAMREFLRVELRHATRQYGAQLGLYNALMENGHLRIEYDGSRTRTAAEAFDARAGNCLSLVLMTAAFAREMKLNVHYQLVEIPDIWTRSQQFTLLNDHVNLSLSDRVRGHTPTTLGTLTVDFQPIEDPRLARARRLSEEAVVAMYFNNRAVELLELGRHAEAYQALRAALRSDPEYLNALNTLAVLHRRQGDLARAEAALRLLIAHQPYNRHAATNLVTVLEDAGRHEEAQTLARTLPPSPFADLERGQALARAGRWAEALRAYERQLRVAPDFHALHLEMARAHLQLGDLGGAQRHLQLAFDTAPSLDWRQAYQAKLRALRRLQQG